jgi:hypothetical protein
MCQPYQYANEMNLGADAFHDLMFEMARGLTIGMAGLLSYLLIHPYLAVSSDGHLQTRRVLDDMIRPCAIWTSLQPHDMPEERFLLCIYSSNYVLSACDDYKCPSHGM